MAGMLRSPERLLLTLGALVVGAVVLAALWPGLGRAPRARPTPAPASAPAPATPPDALREPAPRGSARASSPLAPGRAQAELDAPLALRAPRLAVRALGAPDQPLAGAEVVAFLTPAGAREGLVGRLRTDAEGRCSLDVAALQGLHTFELESLAVLVRVSHPGWRPHEWRLRPAQLYQPGFELRAVLQPGGGVMGRVLGSDGQPLAGASVTLLGAREPPEDDLAMLARTSSAADGSFQAGHPGRAGPAVVIAAHSGHGALRRQLALGGATGIDLGDLQLVPAGVLEGRVAFPDGSPARRAQVLATAVQTSRFEAVLPDVTSVPGGRVECDDAGRFRFALLQEGVYRLDVGNPYTLDRTFSERPLRTFRTPGLELLLEADHVALCVRVVDRSGRALEGVSVEARRVRSRDGTPEGESSGQLRLLDKTFARSRGRPPEAILPADPGDRVVLRAEPAACYPAQALVNVQPAPGEQAVTLEVFSRTEAVRLRPRVHDAAGAPVRAYAVDVFDPFTRLALRTGLEPDDDGVLPVLHPGPLLLRARSPQAPAHTDGPLPAGLGRTVELRPGSTREVELRLE
jgi:hypothetical protein